MNRRRFMLILSAASMLILGRQTTQAKGGKMSDSVSRISRSAEEWRRLLSPAQFHILREEGTERPWTSTLLDEKREGIYICAGCDQPLFRSTMKFDSGTGWPSFFTYIDNALETKRDFKLVWQRQGYHCARCGGHHGHIFKDGPKPTGLRYCNNGDALKFIPNQA